MNKNKINNLLNFLAPTLIFSYFMIQNIYLVVIGIIISLYLINIKSIDRIIISIYDFCIKLNSYKKFNTKSKVIKNKFYNENFIDSNPKQSLVEKIEELGFIPSLDKKDNNNPI